MALNVNRVLIAGNLTRDPELRNVGDHRAVANFSIAVNRKYRDAQGGSKEETTFVDVTAWGRTAELVGQYLTKGSGAFIEGRLKLEQWVDKNSGDNRTRLGVVADSVQFVGGRNQEGSGARTAAKAPPKPGTTAVPLDDEPPF